MALTEVHLLLGHVVKELLDLCFQLGGPFLKYCKGLHVVMELFNSCKSEQSHRDIFVSQSPCESKLGLRASYFVGNCFNAFKCGNSLLLLSFTEPFVKVLAKVFL